MQSGKAGDSDSLYFTDMQRTVQDQDNPFILYVDDDPDDLDLFIYTIGKINPSLLTQVFTDGREAFEFLESIPAGNRLPCLIILDLNMPDWNGLTTMEAIKKKQGLPVYSSFNIYHFRFSPASRVCIVRGSC